MSDAWDDMRRAKEEEYFGKENKAALDRISARKADKPRLCPVNGASLKQEVTMGIVIDKCPDCGGVWLDNGELEQLLTAGSAGEPGRLAWITENLIGGVLGRGFKK